MERVVLLSPVDFAVEKKHPMFVKILGLSRVKVTIADVTEILEESTAKALRQGAVEPRRVPRVEIHAFLADGGDGRERVVDESFGRERAPVLVAGATWTPLR